MAIWHNPIFKRFIYKSEHLLKKMGLFNILKKRDVPKELPSLAMGSSTSNSLPTMNAQPSGSSVLDAIKRKREESSAQLPVQKSLQVESKYKPLPVQKIDIPKNTNEEERGFFRELMKDLTQEVESERITEISRSKLLSEDIVSQMKEYWHQQKPELLLKSVGGELKQKLLEKTDKLHALEKEWQDSYFEVLTKEDKIRKEESELKKILSDLMDLYQKSLKDKDTPRKNKSSQDK